ncbi:hypothetical protein BS17DRAFT_292683 [Gyrodon lividus]|nr:hypothetical protein BS17DRAFT_292683 [Gyrodon lividus]
MITVQYGPKHAPPCRAVSRHSLPHRLAIPGSAASQSWPLLLVLPIHCLIHPAALPRLWLVFATSALIPRQDCQ